MEYTDWAALVAAIAAVVVALPAIPKSDGRRYWMSGGIVLLVVAAALGVVAARQPAPDPEPGPSPSIPSGPSSSAAVTPSADVSTIVRTSPTVRGVSKATFLAIAAVSRPRADDAELTDLFAQRQHPNDVFLRSAKAYEAGQSVTGEQFLSTAVGIEADYRAAARTFGFSICVGADAPGD